MLWVGAGTRDTGLSLTHLTFQVTHATASDTNVERDYIIDALRAIGSIEAVKVYQAGQCRTERVNHYTTDGRVTLAVLRDRRTLRGLALLRENMVRQTSGLNATPCASSHSGHVTSQMSQTETMMTAINRA